MLARLKGHGIHCKNSLTTTATAPLIVTFVLNRAPNHHDGIGKQRQSRRQ
jgi:hypothetical protein